MRFYPRIKTDIAANIYSEFKHLDVSIVDLSIGGALVKRNFPKTSENGFNNKPVLIKYALPEFGSIEHTGNIIREDDTGKLALSFGDMDQNSKIKLWQYIAENLKDLHECPYCGEKFDIAPSVCGVCGWKLTFDSPEYFEYHEKTHLLKKIYLLAESLEKDQIKKLANLVNTEFNNNLAQPAAAAATEFNYEFIRQKSSLKELKETIEKQKVREILETHGDNISKAAKLLGVSRPTLYNFKRKYNL